MKKVIVLSMALFAAGLTSNANELTTLNSTENTAMFTNMASKGNPKKDLKKKKKALNKKEQGLKEQANLVNEQQRLLKQERKLNKRQSRVAKAERKAAKANRS